VGTQSSQLERRYAMMETHLETMAAALIARSLFLFTFLPQYCAHLPLIKIEIGYLCPTPGQPCDVCPEGKFGLNCLKDCQCANNASCNPVNGDCSCPSPWEGAKCDTLSAPSSTETSDAIQITVNQINSVEFEGVFSSELTFIGSLFLFFNEINTVLFSLT